MSEGASPLVWIGVAAAVAGVIAYGLREILRGDMNSAPRSARLPTKLSCAGEKQALLDWLDRYRQAYLPYYTWSSSVDAGLDHVQQKALGLDNSIPDKPVMQIIDVMKGLDAIAFEQAAQQLARERGIKLDESSPPYSALCEDEKNKARAIAREAVDMIVRAA